MQHGQATTALFGSEPQAFTGRVDGNALEALVEMQQHAAGAGLADHGAGQVEPLGAAIAGDLQHGGAGLADQVAIALRVAGQAFEVQLAAAYQPGRPVAHAQAPGQGAFRRFGGDEGLRLGTQQVILLVQLVEAIVVTIGHRP